MTGKARPDNGPPAWLAWAGVAVAPFLLYVAVYLATGFTVIELTRVIPYVDWAIEFVVNPVFCGGVTVLLTAAFAPSRPALAALWALAVVTVAVAIPASATFLFGDAGLTPVIATIAGGLAAVLMAWTDRSQAKDE